MDKRAKRIKKGIYLGRNARRKGGRGAHPHKKKTI